MPEYLRAGFDYSWNEASFSCVRGDGSVLFDEFIALPPRNASSLPDWMEKCLENAGTSFDAVSEWSVGNGPGSFTGLRLAAAFVMGRSFRKSGVRTRGVSTASAMAATAGFSGSGKSVAALFDGRRNEILAYGLDARGTSFAPSGFHAVIGTAASARLDAFDAFVCLARDAGQIRLAAGASVKEKLFPVEHIRASALVFNEPDDFSMPLTEPVYLRPAVFVEPKIPRTL